MRNLLFLLSLIVHTANAQWYYGTGEATNLENNIGFDKHTQKIISGSAVDPSSTSTSGGAGSLLLKTDGSLFVKKDAGSTTNWKKFFDSSYGFSAGALADPVWTDNGDGTITVNALDVNIFDNANHVGFPFRITATGITNLALPDGMNYIVAYYNGPGDVILTSTPNVDLINESSIIPILSVHKETVIGVPTLTVMPWDTLGKGLANKTHQSIVKTQRYRRESGLALSSTSLQPNVTAGILWVGANKLSLNAFTAGGGMYYYNRSGSSSWFVDIQTDLNNTQYFNTTTNTNTTLTNNRYAVNWIYRTVGNTAILNYVLGEGDYTLTEALASQPPANLPSRVRNLGVLVGRVIYQKGATTPAKVDSAFDIAFAGSGVADHNSLNGLQGGTTNEYYHLTSTGKTAADTLTGTANYVSKFTGTGLTASQIFDDGTSVGVGTSSPSASYKLDILGNLRNVGTLSVQSGAAAGSVRVGADVNGTTITDGVRKIARFTMPAWLLATPDVAFFATDVTSASNNTVIFGGVPGSTAVTGATLLQFATAATATTTGGTVHMSLTSSGFLGLGTSNPTSKLTVVGGVNGTETVTSTAGGSLSPNLFTVNINPASTSSTEIRALGFSATTQGSSALATVRGGYFEVRNTGSGTISTANGVYSTGMIFPSASQNFGTISEVASFLAVPINSFSNTVTGTISNARGLRINTAGLTANQTLTNQIGVSIDALTTGTNNTHLLLGTSTAPTSNWGIYNASASNNYFNGNIGVGATTATTKLYVTGDSTVTGYQYFGDPATNGSFRMYVSGGALKIEKRISGTWTSVGQFDEL